MSCNIVLGAQFGDEGKGKVIDVLSEKADVVVRFQGGNNAGHTLIYKGEKLVCHLIPSGILHPNKLCAIGNGVVIDLEELHKEVQKIEQLGVKVTPARLFISNKAHVILPIYRLIDKERETGKGKLKIGTTLRGIGPAYEFKAARVGLRINDLLCEKTLKLALDQLYQYLEANFCYQHLIEKEGPTRTYDMLRELGTFFRPYIAEVSQLVYKWKQEGKRMLFEGAQGTMLDIDHGTFPYVTSSNTTAGGACTGSGLSPRYVDNIIGVTKAYVTRVGEGILPTELFDKDGEQLAKAGNEFGATTGRPRRCGWLDLVALKYAVEINGINQLILTKLDVLSGFSTIKCCRSYEINGEKTTDYPTDYEQLKLAVPVYEELPGWNSDVQDVREYDSLPAKARGLVHLIEAHLDVKVILVSVGPGREHIIRANES